MKNKRIKKLAKALRRIQKECEQYENCEECPFANYGVCEIKEEDPKDWNIAVKTKMLW